VFADKNKLKKVIVV